MLSSGASDTGEQAATIISRPYSWGRIDMADKRGIRRAEGMVLSIQLAGDVWAFARTLVEPLVEFIDHQASAPDARTEDVLRHDVAFRIWVMNSAITSGRWTAIGTVPLSDAERQTTHRFFKQDALSGALTQYWTDPMTIQSFEEPAAERVCRGLERAAVWSPAHVEDRLRDHFAGRENPWTVSLRPMARLPRQPEVGR